MQNLGAMVYSSAAAIAVQAVTPPAITMEIDNVATFAESPPAGVVVLSLKTEDVPRRVLGMDGVVGGSPGDTTLIEDLYLLRPVRYKNDTKESRGELVKIGRATWPVLNANTRSNPDARAGSRRCVTVTFASDNVLGALTTVDVVTFNGYSAGLVLYDVGPFTHLVRVPVSNDTSKMTCAPTHQSWE